LSRVFLFKVLGSSEEMMKKIIRDCSGSDILNLSIRTIPFFISWARIEKEAANRAGDYGLERIEGI
jgi:hypothetical protein